MTEKTSAGPNRRKVLSLIAVGAAGGVMMPRAAFAAATESSGKGLLLDTDVCAIVPEVTEGPYYFDPQLERADITEDRPGLPLQLQMQVVDETCTPLAGARVDVWHADATGIYSGCVNQSDSGSVSTGNETFMRGSQFAGDDGIVTFETVYPGWYRGRTTHIHFKVFLDQSNILTGQIFFPDDLSDQVYASVSPYDQRTAERDTRNTADRIAQQAGDASYATVEQLADKYVAKLIVGVDPTAVSAGFGGGFGLPSA